MSQVYNRPFLSALVFLSFVFQPLLSPEILQSLSLHQDDTCIICTPSKNTQPSTLCRSPAPTPAHTSAARAAPPPSPHNRQPMTPTPSYPRSANPNPRPKTA